ncbi:MAG: septation regulator SpoVG [Firmicutes bacterium]|nr:septation regulator SpoVG [Bacillota bacterium]
MNITEVRIRMVKKDDGKLRAVASLTIDDALVIHDIKIIQGIRGPAGYFIAMPSKKTPDGEYKDIVHPLNNEMRELLSKTVLGAFEEELAKLPQTESAPVSTAETDIAPPQEPETELH